MRATIYARAGFRDAAVDIKQAVLLCPSKKEARQMVAAIKQRKAAAAKRDRRLAKQVGQWVDQAMSGGGQQGTGSGGEAA